MNVQKQPTNTKYSWTVLLWNPTYYDNWLTVVAPQPAVWSRFGSQLDASVDALPKLAATVSLPQFANTAGANRCL